MCIRDSQRRVHGTTVSQFLPPERGPSSSISAPIGAPPPFAGPSLFGERNPFGPGSTNHSFAAGTNITPTSGPGNQPSSGFVHPPPSGFGNQPQSTSFGNQPSGGYGNQPPVFGAPSGGSMHQHSTTFPTFGGSK
eukprot:TRINITY_DN8036_c0_g2_i1.p1 TRINITY_DN8036_c0_g2~~TRINITY_DN8036_c0_g2_i1.p1  ORF type:complete len:135 (-),score=17.40 TRINITY_DN8036_c0_g2_i1:132-536(-)